VMWNGRSRASAALVPWPTALASGSERRGIEETPADIRGQARDVVLVAVVSQGTGPGNGAGGEHGPAFKGAAGYTEILFLRHGPMTRGPPSLPCHRRRALLSISVFERRPVFQSEPEVLR
jgi:hypothetical protein